MEVKNLKNKNQYVIIDNNKIVFQSYNSIIAIIEDNIITLSDKWCYSQTTLNYLYMFLGEYAPGLYNQLKYATNKKTKIKELINNNIIKFNENLKR